MASGRNPLLDKTNQSQSRVGSGFTNLQRVLDANKGNRLGQTLTTGVGQLAQQNKQAVAGAQTQFQTEAEKGRLDTDANTQFRNQAIQNSRSGSATDEDAERFQALQAGQYSGPRQLTNVDALKGQAEQVQQLGTFGTDANKTKGLLQKFVGSPRYSLGQKTLDSTVLSQDPNVARGIRQQTVGVQRGVNRAASAASAQAQELANRAKGFGQETQQQAVGEATAYDTELQAKAAQANAQRAALQNKAKEQLANIYNTNTVSKDVADALGITNNMEYVGTVSPEGSSEQFNPVSAQNMSGYFQYDPTQATKQTIQSQGDAARLAALKKLSGQTLTTGDIAKTVGQYADPNMVGQFAATPVATFAKDAYQADLDRQNQFLQGAAVSGTISRLGEKIHGLEAEQFINQGVPGTQQSREDILNRNYESLTSGNDQYIRSYLNNLAQTDPQLTNILQNAQSNNVPMNSVLQQLKANPEYAGKLPTTVSDVANTQYASQTGLQNNINNLLEWYKAKNSLETLKNKNRKIKVVE